MIVAALVCAAVALIVSTIAVLTVRRPLTVLAEPDFLEGQMRHEVVVTLKSGSAFRGVLFSADPQVLVLRNARAVGVDGQTVVVDGEMVVLTGEVDYLQRP